MDKHQNSLQKFQKMVCHLVGTIGVVVGLAIGVILKLYCSRKYYSCMYTRASVLPGMIPWFVILISQIKFRKTKGAEMDSHPFKMPFAPVTNYLTIAFLIIVLVGMWFNDETRISLIAGIVFLALVTIGFYVFGINKRVPADQEKDEIA